MNELFFIFSILICFSSLMCINSLNPIHSIFWLVNIFFFSFGLLVDLNLEFLSLLIIMIYVGAIVILFLFVIMMLDIIKIKKTINLNNIIPIISMCLLILIIFFSSKENLTKVIISKNLINLKWVIFSQFHIFSLDFYSNHCINFILVSILLTIGIIGAIILALTNDFNFKKQKIFIQHFRNNSWT